MQKLTQNTTVVLIARGWKDSRGETWGKYWVYKVKTSSLQFLLTYKNESTPACPECTQDLRGEGADQGTESKMSNVALNLRRVCFLASKETPSKWRICRSRKMDAKSKPPPICHRSWTWRGGVSCKPGAAQSEFVGTLETRVRWSRFCSEETKWSVALI